MRLDVKEAIPPSAPEVRGKGVDLHLYVDSDHAGEEVTRCSRTGFFIFLNMAPVVWFSKRQPTIETSVFGAEFVAMKNKERYGDPQGTLIQIADDGCAFVWAIIHLRC